MHIVSHKVEESPNAGYQDRSPCRSVPIYASDMGIVLCKRVCTSLEKTDQPLFGALAVQ